MVADLVLRLLVLPYLLLCEHYGIAVGIFVMTLPITLPIALVVCKHRRR